MKTQKAGGTAYNDLIKTVIFTAGLPADGSRRAILSHLM